MLCSCPAFPLAEPRKQSPELHSIQVCEVAPPLVADLDSQHVTDHLHGLQPATLLALPQALFTAALFALSQAFFTAALLGHRQRASLVLDLRFQRGCTFPLGRREARDARRVEGSDAVLAIPITFASMWCSPRLPLTPWNIDSIAK